MILVSDSRINLRNFGLVYKEAKGESRVVEAWLINIFVAGKTDNPDGEIINGLDYLDVDLPLPKIKPKTPANIREFLNVQLTNEINRKFSVMIGKAKIENYETDRDEIIDAARDDRRFSKFLEMVEEYNWKHRLEDFNIEVSPEDYDYLRTGNVKLIIYPIPVKVVFVEEKLIPRSPELENGETMRITANRKLYKLLAEDISINEIVVFDDNDESFIVAESVYGYPTIKKDNLDSYFWLKIHL